MLRLVIPVSHGDSWPLDKVPVQIYFSDYINLIHFTCCPLSLSGPMTPLSADQPSRERNNEISPSSKLKHFYCPLSLVTLEWVTSLMWQSTWRISLRISWLSRGDTSHIHIYWESPALERVGSTRLHWSSLTVCWAVPPARPQTWCPKFKE